MSSAAEFATVDNLSEESEISFDPQEEQTPENRENILPSEHRVGGRSLALHDQVVGERSSPATDQRTTQHQKSDKKKLYRPRRVTDAYESESEECMQNIPRLNLDGDREKPSARPTSFHRARGQESDYGHPSHRSRGTYRRTEDHNHGPRTNPMSSRDAGSNTDHQNLSPVTVRYYSPTADCGDYDRNACDPNNHLRSDARPSVQTQPQSIVYSLVQIAMGHDDQTPDQSVNRYDPNACYPRFSERRNASPSTPFHTHLDIPRTRVTPYDDPDPDHHIPRLNACLSPFPSGHDLAQPGVSIRERARSPDLVVDELIKRLRQRYGSVGRTATHRNELHLRKQKEHESVRDLMNDLKRLMFLAYKDAGGETANSILFYAFINALSERTLAWKIRELEPSYIETAYHHAIRLEAYKNMYEEEEIDTKRRPHRFVRGTVDDDSQDPVLTKLNQILKTQEENFHSWREHLEVRLSDLEKTTEITPHPKNYSLKCAPLAPPAVRQERYSENPV